MRRTTRPRRVLAERGSTDARRRWIATRLRDALLLLATAPTMATSTALAGSPLTPFFAADPTRDNPAGLAVLIGLVLFATFTSILHLVGRRQWAQRETALTTELSRMQARVDRANLFLSTDPQIVVAWSSATGEPDVEGE